MLTATFQKNSFDQFLFSHFDIKRESQSVSEADFCVADKIKATKPKPLKKRTVKKTKAVPVKKAIAKPAKAKVTATKSVVEEKPSLIEIIDSIPDRVRSIDINELAQKQEHEWYHAFRDLKEELSNDIAKTHPNHHGSLKLKSEIKEFWEQFDEHLEKVILELERIFQVFPQMSRVAIIYLASAIIAIPLVFFSTSTFMQASTFPTSPQNTNKAHAISIKLDPQSKAEYIAQNSARIIASGQDTFQVSVGTKQGKVAGVYEERDASVNGEVLRQKISNWYKSLVDWKDELGYFVSKNVGK